VVLSESVSGYPISERHPDPDWDFCRFVCPAFAALDQPRIVGAADDPGIVALLHGPTSCPSTAPSSNGTLPVGQLSEQALRSNPRTRPEASKGASTIAAWVPTSETRASRPGTSISAWSWKQASTVKLESVRFSWGPPGGLIVLP
jgi:hypothetical protein